MANSLSPRLAAVVDALPLRPGLRVLEIGCGPGAVARAIASRIGDGHVLAIDRYSKAMDATPKPDGAPGDAMTAAIPSARLR